MRLIRELSLLLNLVAGLIILTWAVYKGVAAIAPGLGSAVEFLGRAFFANSDVPLAVRMALPMLVLGIVLFFLSDGKRKPEAAD